MRNVDPDAGIDWLNLLHVKLPRVSGKAFLRSGDTILSTRGDRRFAYCINNVQGKTVCSPHFFVIRMTHEALQPQFLTWQINQKPAQDYFTTGATDSHILNLNRAVIKGLPITVSPIPQQQHIVALDVATKAERLILNHLTENRTIEMNAIAKELLTPI